VVTLALVVALCAGLGALAARVLAFGAAISPHPALSTQTSFMSGMERVNLAVLGYGGAGHDGAYLSDSIMVISLSPTDHATTLISVPRDLWVQIPPNSGQYGKLNTAFQDGYTNGYDSGNGRLTPGQIAGGTEAAAKISDVTGLDVPYFLTINFQGFRELVDSLGGVDVNVPVAFTARYPINDDPQINAGWKTIHFNTGPQHMNGERAIEYARARYVLQPASEGTDFARSVRQQLLIRAIIDRLKSPEAWPGLSNAMTALQHAIYTNLSLADLAAFTMKLDLSHAERIGLTNENVLVDAQSSDGQDILLPRNGDWDAIKRYVSGHLKT
jgi:LCP family protein required for cell wall assembly